MNYRRPRLIWRKADDDFLIENYGTLPVIDLMRKLNRSYGSIVQRVAYLRRKGKML